MTQILVPHFQLPFQFVTNANGETHAAVNEQDSLEDVTDCITAIVRTPLGYREEMPDFGIRDQTFTEGSVNVEEIQTAIMLWEPRAEIIISDDSSMLQYFIDQVTVKSAAVNPITPMPNEQDVSS